MMNHKDYSIFITNKLRLIVVFIIAFSLVILYILTAPIHVDEGWYYEVARAKNTIGSYTFPAFYDVGLFQSDLMILRDLMTQLYRLADLLFSNGVVAIKFLRLFFFGLWITFFYVFLSSQFPDWQKRERIVVLICLMTFPPVFIVLGIARAEVLISALTALLLSIYLWNIDSSYKFFLLVFFSTLVLLLHPNGIIYFFIIGLWLVSMRNKRQLLIGCTFMACLGIGYYLIFIDPNIALYKKQFHAMYQGGNESKFLFSLAKLPQFIISEISLRYFPLNALQQKVFSLSSICAFLTVIITISGLISLFRHRQFVIIRLYIFSIMLFFVLLGNKTPLYLIYILPFFLIATLYSFSFLESRKWILEMAIISFCIVIGLAVVVNSKEQKEMGELIRAVKLNVAPGSVLYAPFNLYPYLGDRYIYLTTNQKSKAQMYQIYGIRPSHCFIIAVGNDEIWRFCKGQRTDITRVGRYIVGRIGG
jgi:hypothetical protein